MSQRDERLPCPICQGRGTVTHIDDEVGCQVEIPCWACSEVREADAGPPLPP